MRALVWQGKENVQVDTVPDPQVQDPRDIVIRVTATAICGSDLHLYHGRIPLEQFDGGCDLVDVCTGRGGPRPPLHSVDGSEFTCGRGPFVPDCHAVLLEPAHVGVAAQEPQQFVDHRLGVDFLGGDQRKTGGQVIAHLMPEQAAGAGAGAIGFGNSLGEHQAKQVLVRGWNRHIRSLRADGSGRTDGMPTITDVITTSDGSCPVTLALPEGEGPWPGVVMYPDAGGARPAFTEMAQRLAGYGYAVLVPDVYYRDPGWAPFDMAKVQAALKTYIDAAKKTPDLFPDDSKTGGETTVLPAIWEKKAEFNAIFTKWAADSVAAQTAIKDEASFKTEWPKVMSNCGTCHKAYRVPPKQ